MQVLIADDDATSRNLVCELLTQWGYDAHAATDGKQALAALQQPQGPSLAILDWMMPGMVGPDVCRRVRDSDLGRPMYLILLTSLEQTANIVEGLESGADDYLAKPFHPGELRARVRSGERVVRLESELRANVTALQEALDRVKRLQGLLPICSYCMKIRDDQDYWVQVDRYLAHNADVRFSHGICPRCYDEVMEPQIERAENKRRGNGGS